MTERVAVNERTPREPPTDNRYTLKDLEGKRAAELVSRLSKAVQRGQVVGEQGVCLQEQVREAIRLGRPRWKDEMEAKGVYVEVITDLEETADVCGTAAEIGEIVLNLLFNAVDAMPHGGKITIQSRVEDTAVVLSVADTGVGMAEEVRSRVFEPFFTTKRDVGSGLGLSTVYGAVTRWGGDIEVDSSPGEGATFTLRLPLWDGGSANEHSSESASQPDPVRHARILIVEDDEAVSGPLGRLLSTCHAVQIEADGAGAMQHFAPDRFDVAFIDLGLPGLPGDVIAGKFRNLDPAVATVMITGWVLEEDDPRRQQFDFYLQKPVLNEDVDRTLSQAIELHDSRLAP